MQAQSSFIPVSAYLVLFFLFVVLTFFFFFFKNATNLKSDLIKFLACL